MKLLKNEDEINSVFKSSVQRGKKIIIRMRKHPNGKRSVRDLCTTKGISRSPGRILGRVTVKLNPNSGNLGA